MPNVSKINGFRPVKHTTGAPYNGQANIYVLGGTTNVVPGDVVYVTGTGQAESGIPQVTATASALMAGPVVGVINVKLDPVTGRMTSGSIALDTPQVAVPGAYVLVADAMDVICEVEKASFAVTDIGLNLDVSGTAGGVAATGTSQQLLGTASVNANWRVLSLSQTVNNEVGANAKVLVAPAASNFRNLVTAV